jgi:hypothetical protein
VMRRAQPSNAGSAGTSTGTTDAAGTGAGTNEAEAPA